MLEVDAPSQEEVADFGEGARVAINRILARVVLIRCASDNDL
jgi:hypothetical protein